MSERKTKAGVELVKCANLECGRTTRNLETANWSYVDGFALFDVAGKQVAGDGYWCRKCTEKLHQFLVAQGIEPTIGRLSSANRSQQ